MDARPGSTLLVAVMIGVVIGVLSGCAGPATPPGPATYHLPPRPVRSGEVALDLPPVQVGPSEITLLGLTSLPAIEGSHAEMTPHGRYLRIRLLDENVGRANTQFDTAKQQLITADGVAHDIDTQAMLIRRQPDTIPLGSNVRVEFDLFYDIPVTAVPVALRIHGGLTLTDLRDDQYQDVPLTARR